MTFDKHLPSFSPQRLCSFVLGAIVVVGVPSACSGRTDVEVQQVSVESEGTMLVFLVNTCNEASTEVSVNESDNEIVATASTSFGYGCGGRDDCQDARSVKLDEPLGDRRIVDGTGNEIEILRLDG
jgi:hypothetical protein